MTIDARTLSADEFKGLVRQVCYPQSVRKPAVLPEGMVDAMSLSEADYRAFERRVLGGR